jgi:hypothetical protein
VLFSRKCFNIILNGQSFKISCVDSKYPASKRGIIVKKIFRCLLFLSLLLSNTEGIRGQWTNRYPKLAHVSHHVYLEGYNLPTLNQGATDPAPSPDGKTLAIAARGWIWLMDTTTREAKRLTKTARLIRVPAGRPTAVKSSLSETIRKIRASF